MGDTNGDNSASLLEWLIFWTSKYCSEQSAVRIAAVTDVDEDGAISSDEWIAPFLRLKAPTFYPSLEQLHFEEFMQYEQAAWRHQDQSNSINIITHCAPIILSK